MLCTFNRYRKPIILLYVSNLVKYTQHFKFIIINRIDGVVYPRQLSFLIDDQ